MEQLNKKLSKTNLILLVLLVFVGLGLLYYFVIYSPTEQKIADLKSQQTTVQTAIDALTVQTQLLKNMNTELEELKKVNMPIPRYDNQKPILASLNNILTASQIFEVSFEIAEKEETAEGEAAPKDKDIVRRIANVEFACTGFQQAKKIVTSLNDIGFRAQINHFELSSDQEAKQNQADTAGDISLDQVQGNVSIVFYETLK